MIDSNHSISVVTGRWETTFIKLIGSARTRLLLCAPFVSEGGADAVIHGRSGKESLAERSVILTDLSPRAVCTGATNPEALVRIVSTLRDSQLIHLPRVHAKVYVADGERAIVSSGNLTSGGLSHNFECGVSVADPDLAGRIEQDINDYAELGALIDVDSLARYCEAATDARQAYQQQVESTAYAVQRQLRMALAAADDHLIRARLAGGARHTVFAKTVLYLLRKNGPLTTQQMHPLIQKLHPDLCDDSIDRVIDGKRFGKKWKHAVRTAQQQLKKQGRIRLAGDRWIGE